MELHGRSHGGQLDLARRRQPDLACGASAQAPPVIHVTLPAQCKGCSNTTAAIDVTYGDVWFCSGQSNMELPMTHALTRNRTYRALRPAWHVHKHPRTASTPRCSTATWVPTRVRHPAPAPARRGLRRHGRAELHLRVVSPPQLEHNGRFLRSGSSPRSSPTSRWTRTRRRP